MNKSGKRLSVLISSHEFSPDQGSECAVGWNICTRMAAFHDVTVLCASGSPHNPTAYRDAFNRYIGQNGNIHGLKVVFVDQPPMTLWYGNLNKKYFDISDGAGFRPLFYKGLDLWNRSSFQVALELGIDNFDIIHKLTPVGFRNPGYLWNTKIPFVWGPIGGMYKVPAIFAIWLGSKTFLFEVIRSLISEWQARMTTNVRKAARKASLVWTITDSELRMINRISDSKVISMNEAGAPTDVPNRLRMYDGRRPLRLCWSGRHDATKALPILIHALSGMRNQQQVTLDVMGEGAETNRWKELAAKCGLKQISWHGYLPYNKALQQMEIADIFIHTSVREATATVILEALASGLPVVCHSACGMALAIDDSCGIKVPFINPPKSIEGFRNAIDIILQNPDLIEKLSAGALKRAEILSWDAKVKEIAESYWQFV